MDVIGGGRVPVFYYVLNCLKTMPYLDLGLIELLTL
jgi:hypothetical protein